MCPEFFNKRGRIFREALIVMRAVARGGEGICSFEICWTLRIESFCTQREMTYILHGVECGMRVRGGTENTTGEVIQGGEIWGTDVAEQQKAVGGKCAMDGTRDALLGGGGHGGDGVGEIGREVEHGKRHVTRIGGGGDDSMRLVLLAA